MKAAVNVCSLCPCLAETLLNDSCSTADCPLRKSLPLSSTDKNEYAAIYESNSTFPAVCVPEDAQHNLSSHTSPVIHAQPKHISAWTWHSKGVHQEMPWQNRGGGSEQLLKKVHFPFTQPVPVTLKFRPGGAAWVMLDVRYDICCNSWACQCW